MIASTSSSDIRLKLVPARAGIVTDRLTLLVPSMDALPVASPDNVRVNGFVRASAVVALPAVVAEVAVVADPAVVA